MAAIQLSVLATLAVLGQCNPKGLKVAHARAFAHVGAPWTQGLEFFEQGKLLETVGAYPAGTKSSIRVLDLTTGEVIRTTDEGMKGRFAEGITRSGDGWMASTYDSSKAMKYNLELSSFSEIDYPWEGWGLSHSPDGSKLYATNGSTYVMELHPETLALERTKTATCFKMAAPGLNELEMVGDFFGLGPTLLANLYESRFILGFDPTTMECNCVFDLEGLGEALDPQERYGLHVANGIAHLPDSGNLVVTGKNWKNMFEVSLVEDSDSEVGMKLQKWLGSKGQTIFLESGEEVLSQVPGERPFSHGRKPFLRANHAQGHLHL